MAKEEKNNQEKEFKGKNLDEVISNAEHVLKLPRNKINYEVVTEKTRLFGIKTKEIVIRAWPREESEENPVAQFLDKVLSRLPLDIKYQIKRKNDMIYLIFEGGDKHFLLQKDGSLLQAFQHILNKISPQKVQVDCDFYRKNQEKELSDYAQHIAHQVHETGKDEILDMMNPYERRIVHIAVNQVSGTTTESIGDGFLKRIKIFPVKSEAK
ncbi:MAG: Jag N-terminal domain-containing protein [Candidatus Aminicenantes bacterium]|jgi:spoIIIJ-associated protein|nr:Jag N-terminal domain-containing protein [Candidatus Aminicenantes bacterium]